MIDLIVDNEITDSFFVLEKWMKSRAHYKESIHKVGMDTDAIITRAATHKSKQIHGDYTANP